MTTRPDTTDDPITKTRAIIDAIVQQGEDRVRRYKLIIRWLLVSYVGFVLLVIAPALILADQ